jgi:hypothetical protein
MNAQNVSKSAQPVLHRRRFLEAMAILPIAACTTSPVLTSVLRNARIAAVGFPDAPVTRAQVDALPYASVFARIGKGPRSLLVLAEADPPELRWLSADNAMLVTRSGRIVKTAGLPDDLSGTRFPRGGDMVGRPAGELTGGLQTRLIDLKSRFQYGTPVSSYFTIDGHEQISILEQSHETLRVSEQNHCPQLDWKFNNTWWIDPATGFVWKSLQWLTPDMPVFEMAVLKPAAV